MTITPPDLSLPSAPPLQPVAKVRTVKEWSRDKDRAHRVFHSKATAIAQAPENGKKVKNAVREFLGDPNVRLSATLRALGRQPDPTEAFDLRNRVNCWATGYPPVVWYPKKKSSGGYRPICKLPPAMKAAHYMLAAIIDALLPETRTLYGIPGKGVADGLRELKALQNAGFVHLAKTDIVNCFQSVDPDTLYQLPLPMEVIRRTLDYRNLTFIGGANQNASQVFLGYSSCVYDRLHKASGPKGLLQGSPASSVILAWLLKDIPTSDDARVMLCFDNIVVAARTPDGTRGMMETLTAYLGHSPAGPLAKCDATFADNEPLEFLGGLFDPARPDIGIASETMSRIERMLGEMEEADQMEMCRILAEHQKYAAGNALLSARNPLQARYPTGIWHLLRDISAGLPFLEVDCAELLLFLEASAITVDIRDDRRVSHLHRNLFAPAWTQEGALVRNILRHNPRPQKRKH